MEYAGFFRRLGAYLIDLIILVIPSIFLGVNSGNFPTSFGLGFLIALCYRPVFESSALSATPGKALLGLVVVSESGERINFKTALIRFACSYISMIFLYIGYLMQPFTSRRQTLHDMISETVVIRRESPDLNYFKVWRDQLKDVFSKL